MKELGKYPINRDQNSTLSINRYNRKIASYNLKFKNIEDFIKDEKSYFKNYVIAQALINLKQKYISMKYIKSSVDYFVYTPVEKLDFTPKEEIVHALELKAYGRPISFLAKSYQKSLQKKKSCFFNN